MIDIDKLEALAKAAASRGQEDCESLHDWLSAEEFISNMLLHPVDARFAEACTPGAIRALIAEVRRLHGIECVLLAACVDAILALAHASQSDPMCRPAYDKVSAAIDTVRKEPPCSAG